MSKRLTFVPTLVCAMGALFVVAATAAASAGGGTAVTSSGLVATGWAGPFTVTFVKPTGATTGASTIAGVDLGKPWGSLFELGRSGDASGIGSTAACPTTVTNPASFGAGSIAFDFPPAPGQSPIDPLSGIYFDASCSDGSGYDYYRVHWDDVMDSSGHPWRLFMDNTPGPQLGAFYWGSSVQNGDTNGTLSIPFDNNGWESAQITVYGHNAGGFHLLATGGGEVVPEASDIVTTAW
jgi:hypothetical protein